MQITFTTQWNYSIALYAESKFEITAAVNSFPSLLADRALETQDLVGQILLQRFSLIYCYMQLYSQKYPMVGSSYVQMYPVITSKPVSSTEPLVAQSYGMNCFLSSDTYFPQPAMQVYFKRRENIKLVILDSENRGSQECVKMCSVIGVGSRKLPSGNLQERLHCLLRC